MAFDKLYIINQIIIAVGAKTLGSLSTDTKAQRVVDSIYDGIVDEVLDFNIPYKFASARAELTELDSTPAFGWSHQYGLPGGCVRILTTEDENGRTIQYPYDREVLITRTDNKVTETDIILCDQEQVFVRYIFLRKNPAAWPGYFRRLVILHGAMQLCAPIKKDDFRSLFIEKQFNKAYKRAKGRNGAEGMETDDNDVNLDLGNTDVIDAVQDSERREIWATDD